MSSAVFDFFSGTDIWKKNHVNCGSLNPESVLGFWVDAIGKGLESSQKHLVNDFACKGQQGHSSVAVKYQWILSDS